MVDEMKNGNGVLLFDDVNTMFEEPFLIRFFFADNSSQKMIVRQGELDSLFDQLGPGNRIVIIEDKGLLDVVDRITTNERNLVIMGRDVTALGKIASRQDTDIQEINSRTSSQLVNLGRAVSDVSGNLETHKDFADKKFTALGQSSPLDILPPLFGGIGIGSLVALAIVAFILFRSGGKIF